MKRAIKHNTHPGELLLEDVLKPTGLSIQKASELLGITRVSLSNIIHEKTGISPLMAIRITAVFGGSASFWLKLQAAYDLREAEQFFYNNPPKLTRYNAEAV